MTKLLLPGVSGFSVSFVNETTVRKGAKGPESSRLRKQIKKQSDFHSNFQEGCIRTPRIIHQSEDGAEYYADMEFVPAKDFIQFLTEADRDALDDFCSMIISFIRSSLTGCTICDVTGQVLQKAKELSGRGLRNNYIEALYKRCSKPVLIPVGPCHGDLTLSNILFKKHCIYLIDFLDVFIESPLQDVVKLRQDTRFGWSLELYQVEFDRTKMKIALRYLDDQIHKAFNFYNWYCEHYDLFQFVNLMRVLPYCRNAQTAAFITANLDSMLKNLVKGPHYF